MKLIDLIKEIRVVEPSYKPSDGMIIQLIDFINELPEVARYMDGMDYGKWPNFYDGQWESDEVGREVFQMDECATIYYKPSSLGNSEMNLVNSYFDENDEENSDKFPSIEISFENFLFTIWF